jgi:hypothetical protein
MNALCAVPGDNSLFVQNGMLDLVVRLAQISGYGEGAPPGPNAFTDANSLKRHLLPLEQAVRCALTTPTSQQRRLPRSRARSKTEPPSTDGAAGGRIDYHQLCALELSAAALERMSSALPAARLHLSPAHSKVVKAMVVVERAVSGSIAREQFEHRAAICLGILDLQLHGRPPLAPRSASHALHLALARLAFVACSEPDKPALVLAHLLRAFDAIALPTEPQLLCESSASASPLVGEVDTTVTAFFGGSDHDLFEMAARVLLPKLGAPPNGALALVKHAALVARSLAPTPAPTDELDSNSLEHAPRWRLLIAAAAAKLRKTSGPSAKPSAPAEDAGERARFWSSIDALNTKPAGKGAGLKAVWAEPTDALLIATMLLGDLGSRAHTQTALDVVGEALWDGIEGHMLAMTLVALEERIADRRWTLGGLILVHSAADGKIYLAQEASDEGTNALDCLLRSSDAARVKLYGDLSSAADQIDRECSLTGRSPKTVIREAAVVLGALSDVARDPRAGSSDLARCIADALQASESAVTCSALLTVCASQRLQHRLGPAPPRLGAIVASEPGAPCADQQRLADGRARAFRARALPDAHLASAHAPHATPPRRPVPRVPPSGGAPCVALRPLQDGERSARAPRARAREEPPAEAEARLQEPEGAQGAGRARGVGCSRDSITRRGRARPVGRRLRERRAEGAVADELRGHRQGGLRRAASACSSSGRRPCRQVQGRRRAPAGEGIGAAAHADARQGCAIHRTHRPAPQAAGVERAPSQRSRLCCRRAGHSGGARVATTDFGGARCGRPALAHAGGQLVWREHADARLERDAPCARARRAGQRHAD